MHCVVDGLLRLLDVQVARLAVQTQAPVVIDPVGQVGSLLDLGYERSCADGVDATGREEEYVSRSDIVAGEDIGDGVVTHPVLIFLGRNLLRQAAEQMSSFVRTYHIPHLRLPLHPGVGPGSKFVARMHLDGKVVLSVDELDEQWEFVAGVVPDLLSYQPGLEHMHELRQGFPRQRAVRDHGNMPFDC